ncbi:proteasome assembly chaperone family protein [Humisphaera borealis]|uniref:PAC2 family protein n=1 Tax=Humisphaera borealis TaxID=2807512 RepID=A0A7M2WQ14_9BACT|nr:PAC2 family protein [Humisphaera borealis]QOV87558.1 PAC2 family protein [Humisphaera borealis]
MPHDSLITFDPPLLENGAMLLAFSGWMDGGEVSTGTVNHLLSTLDTRKVAEIDPEGYYIYNFPGTMELASVFRPKVRYEEGLVKSLELPENTFHCDQSRKLVLFTGKEPNLNWRDFGDRILDLARMTGVQRIVFVGSFGGAVPHTREPRLFCSVSHEDLKPEYARYGLKFSDYEGPSSFVSFLLSRAPQVGIRMASIAAEIPGYLEGANPLSIEAVTRRLAKILDLKVDLAAMRLASDDWTSRVSELVEKDNKLRKHIAKLESAYDDALLEAAEE